MKFTCAKSKLVDALSTVQKAVAQRSAIPALEGVLIKASSFNLSLCGYNLELGITTSFPAKISDDGAAVLPAGLLTEIVRKLPSDMVELELLSDFKAKISGGASTFEVVGLDPKDFPLLPEIDNAQSLDFPVNLLRSMIKQTLFAVSDVDSKPVHMGTLFELSSKELRLVSVDGYRLAMRKEPLKSKVEARFVVPGKTLREVLKLLPEDEQKSIKISVGQRHIIFFVEDFSIISRLLEGEFMDYETIIPKESKTKVTANTKSMIESVERVSLLIADRLKSPIRCDFSEHGIALSCDTSSGSAKDEFPAKYESSDETLALAFNDKYMIDALKNSDTDEVLISLNTSLSPIKITAPKSENFTFLVLPVRLKG